MSRIRQNFHEDVEARINKQINMELYAHYVYLSMVGRLKLENHYKTIRYFFIIQLQSYYFARDDIANHGFAKFFKKSSDEERDHAQMFMEYQVSIDGVKVTSLGVSKTLLKLLI